jgi:hypothetical protein
MVAIPMMILAIAITSWTVRREDRIGQALRALVYCNPRSSVSHACQQISID